MILRYRILILLPVFLCFQKIGFAQSVPSTEEDSLQVTLPAVEIQATRSLESGMTTPFSVLVSARPVQRLHMDSGLSLESVLRHLPGVWVNDRGHFAEGERISIRGLGWRAAFGARGVQVLLDGIPVTMPDGQSATEIIDPVFVRKVEVLRGPSSLFWGNSSGGAILLNTTFPVDRPTGRFRFLAGSNGLYNYLGETSLPIGEQQVQVAASYVETDGYRAHSDGSRLRVSAGSRLHLRANQRLDVQFALADQVARSPGALTYEEYYENSRAASTRNITTNSGKQSLQAQLGITYTLQSRQGVFSIFSYGLTRQLDNALPYDVFIPLSRKAGGAKVSYQHDGERTSWGLGLDLSQMVDDRENWNNVSGKKGDILSLDQIEKVGNAAVMAYAKTSLLEDLWLSAGSRIDRVHFSSDDRFLENGSQSGRITFTSVSPAIGLAYQIHPSILVYGNFSTAFETPTTTELVNRPDLTGGFNEDLDPQKTYGFEVGTRNDDRTNRFFFDVALYWLNVTDRLVPFQTEAGGERVFYKNAGLSTHRGIEVSGVYRFNPDRTISLSYSGNQLTYRDELLRGNKLPGVPDHRISLEVDLKVGPLYFDSGIEYVGSFYVDDANTKKTNAYTLLGAGLSSTIDLPRGVRVAPFIRVQNLLDRFFINSVVINARANRFYEPGYGRTMQAGLNVSL